MFHTLYAHTFFLFLRNSQLKTHLTMTYITKQLPTKPTTNTTEYTATMMGMMGDIGSGSASQVPFGV